MSDYGNARSKSQPLQENFLQEAAASYLDALIALGAFRRIVRSKCLKVLKGNLKELGKAYGVELDASTLDDHEFLEADNLQGSETYDSLGAELTHGGSQTFAYLLWDKDHEPPLAPGVGVSIYLEDSHQLMRLAGALRPAYTPAAGDSRVAA